MNDFEAFRNLYYAQKRNYRTLLKMMADFVLIPGLPNDEIKKIINMPVNNVELEFCYTFLELSKRIESKFDFLQDKFMYKPFETDAYSYIIDNVKRNKNMAIDSVIKARGKFSNEEVEKIVDIERMLTISDLLTRCAWDKDAYHKICVEINILYRNYLNELQSFVLTNVFKEDISKLGVSESDKLRFKYLENLSNSHVLAVIKLPFQNENIVGDDKKFNNNIKRAIDYLNYYKKYISNLDLGRSSKEN